MIHRFACYTGRKMVQVGYIPQEKQAVATYGLEVIYSTFVGLLIIFGVSLIGGKALLWLPFVAAFAPLRSTAGGFHAKTQWGCYIIFTTIYIGCGLLSACVGLPAWADVLICCCSLVIVVCLSPVQAINKPLTLRRRERNRKRSIVVMVIDLLVCVFANIIGWNDIYYRMFCCGIIAATGSLLVALIINRKGENKHEEAG